MQQPSTPVVGPVLLAVVAVLSCLAYVTGTVTVTRSEFTWPAGQIGEPVPLVLSAQSPERLATEGPCTAAASADAVDLMSTGKGGTSLILRGQEGRVWMTYAGAQVGEMLPAQGGCRVSMAYARADNMAILAVGDRVTSAPLVPLSVGADEPLYRQFAVTSLHAAPGFEAALTTQPTTFSSSGWRSLLLLLCVGSLVALAVVLRRSHPRSADRIEAPLWAGSDLLVGAVGLVALVVVPPRFDDGWVLTTVRQYGDLGFFSNYYSIDAVAQPQGFWWAWLERLWLTSLGTPGFLIRLPTVLILLGTWWFLRRHVLSRLGLEPAAVWGAAIVASAGMIGLQITIRPEPVVALLLAATISVVVRYALTREPHLLVLLTGLSAFALAAHQTGWVVVAASASALPWALGWLQQRRAWITAAAIAAAGGAVMLTLLMLGSNATLWSRSVRSFAADTSTYQSVLDEGDRIGGLATGVSSPAVTTVAVGLTMLAALGFLLRSQRDDVAGRAAGWSAMAALGGLFLTSSKLIDHYGAVVPAAVVLTAIGLRYIRATVAAGAILAVGLIGLAGLSQAGTWALELDRVTEYVPGPWPAAAEILLVAMIPTVLYALVCRSVSPSRAGALALAWVALVSSTLALAPVVTEGIAQPGSWFGQQLGVLKGRTCGVVDVIRLLRPDLGSLSTTATSQRDPQVALGPDRAAWARGPLFSPIRLDVVSADGSVAPQIMPPSGDIWALVPLPAEAEAVISVQEGVSVVTASVTSEAAGAAHARTPDQWWVDPGFGLQTPCVDSVSIRSGTVEAATSIGRPGWVGQGLLKNSTATHEAGCAGTERSAQGVCVVALPQSGVSPIPRLLREAVG